VQRLPSILYTIIVYFSGYMYITIAEKSQKQEKALKEDRNCGSGIADETRRWTEQGEKQAGILQESEDKES
jgi:hypothetical protein